MDEDYLCELGLLTDCSANSPASKVTRGEGRHHSWLPHLSAEMVCRRAQPQTSAALRENSFGPSKLADATNELGLEKPLLNATTCNSKRINQTPAKQRALEKK
jgi:hypothetical protein